MKKIKKIIKNLLLKNEYSLFKIIFVKKNKQTKTTHKSLRKGPLTKNKGSKEINNAGNDISIFSLKLDIYLEKKLITSSKFLTIFT